MKWTLIVVAMIASAAPVDGQATVDWTSTLPDNGTIRDMATDSAGNTFVIEAVMPGLGVPGDISVTRINANGSTGWTQTFDGGADDDAAAIAVSADESAVYALGRSNRPSTSSDYTILKYDAATGALHWSKYIDGGDQGLDVAADVATTPDGGVVATGGFDTPFGQRDFGTVRLDSNGTVMWTRYYAGFGQFLFQNDDARHVVVDDAGDVVISGNAMSGSDSDIVTIRYDGMTGTELWQAHWTGSNNDVSSGIALTTDGGVVVLGIDDFTSNRRWVLASYNMIDGTQRWSLLYDPGRDDSARHVAVGADGTIYATGSSDPDTLNNSNGDLEAIAVNGTTGSLLWNISFGGGATGEEDFGTRLHPDDFGSLWVIGGTATGSVANRDALLLQLDAATGTTQSVTKVDTTTGSTANREAFRHIGVDAIGRLYAVGEISGGSSSYIATRFQLPSTCFTPLAGSVPGTPGTPTLTGSGVIAAGQTVTLSLSGGLPLGPTSLIVGFSALNLPLFGGLLVPSPDLVLPVDLLDATGALTRTFSWPAIAPGTTFFFQHWNYDPGAAAGYSASNGLSICQP